MSDKAPSVSIGIPTYNRERLIGRAIESALHQDYPHVEIVISDNASTDSTPEICRRYAQEHPNVRYIPQPRNLGAIKNFDAVRRQSSGDFFMWLGDDDWLDPSYVRLALARLQVDTDVALVSGTPLYYVKGIPQGPGRVFSLLQGSAWQRVLAYYWKVGDNGLFYGLMRQAELQGSTLTNFMGSDWLFIANMAARGKVVMLAETGVHRELGGATASYQDIAQVLGLTPLEALFPHLFIAAHAFSEIAFRSPAYRNHLWPTRYVWAASAFGCIVVKASLNQAKRWAVRARNGLRRAFATASASR
jgi:glycosyltransferase involved in cell wall biosynthesis